MTTTRIAAVIAVLVGCASPALADPPVENIYRPVIQVDPAATFAQSPNRGNGGPAAMKPFSEEEKRLFERAQGQLD
jgi:hypothetical protein